MKNDWKIIIATGPLDQDYLNAEIYFQGDEWAELSVFGTQLTIWPKRDGQPWVFTCDEMITILKQAKSRLIGEKPLE